MQILFKTKVLILLLSSAILMVAAGLYVAYKTKNLFDDSASSTERTYAVIVETQKVLTTIQEYQLGGRGYLITGDSSFLEASNLSRGIIPSSIQQLRTLTLDDPVQQLRIDSVEQITTSMIEYIDEYSRTRSEKGFAKAATMVATRKGLLLLRSIRQVITRIENAEYELLRMRKATNEKSVVILYRVFVYLIASLIFVIVILFFTIRFNIRIVGKNKKDELHFRSTLDKMLEGVEILDFDCRYLYVNEAYEKQVKHTSAELLGFTVMDKFPGIENTDIFKAIQRCLKERVHIHLEDNFTFEDGTTTSFEISFQPIPEGIFILSIDITERKRANEEIKRGEERFRALVENSYDIVSINDENFKATYRSPASSRITGWPNDDKHNAVDHTHPDDIGRLRNTIKDALANPGAPFPINFRTKHKEGHDIFVEGVITNMLQNDSIKGILSNFRDVTETRKAEEKIRQSEKIYKTIASSIPGSVICLIDKDYRYTLIEGDMLERMGYSKEQLLGRRLTDVISRERLEEVLPHFKRVFSGESFTVESNRLGLDTVSRYVPLRNEDQEVFATMIVVFDVSELKTAQRVIATLNTNLELKILERTQELETVNKELESFSYSVAHDLRAPLRAVSSYATMLAEDFAHQLGLEGKRLTDAVERNAARMGHLIDDLLAFSKLGRRQIQKSVVDMSEVTRQSLLEVQLDETHPAQINLNITHPVMADFSLMKHVMINLLSNAIKYSSKKEHPLIEISSQKGNEEIIFSIKDNGVGFDMEYADKLFGVFQRLHSRTEFDGTGVGLAIVQRIIHKHHGRVWGTGSVDMGATFSFSLPIVPDHELNFTSKINI